MEKRGRSKTTLSSWVYMDPRFFPRNWDIATRDVPVEETRFVNRLNGASIRLQIPLEYGKVLASAEGCLIFATHGDRTHDDEAELVPYSDDGLSVRGRFYVPTPTGNVRQLELRPRPRLVYVATQEPRNRCDRFSGVTSCLERRSVDDAEIGLVLLRFPPTNVDVFWVDFTDGNGRLTLVEDQKAINNYLLPWLSLGSLDEEVE